MRAKVLISILLGVLTCSLNAFALQDSTDEIEISGLVIDRTLTRFGKDFSFYYSSYWRDLTFTQGFNVTLNETVYPQAGTLLTLEINGINIYSTHFGRRAASVKEKAEQAVLISIDYIAQVKAQALMGELSSDYDGF